MDPSDQELVDTCASLIEVPSIDGDQRSLHEVVRRIREFFQDAPVEISQTEHSGYPSIVVTTKPTRTPRWLLHGHADVVPGAPEQFEPHVADGRLYGRGAVDMKGFVAVAMHVVRDLSRLPNPPDVGLMVNTDEEIGGRHGAKALVEQGWRPQQLINGDGGYGDAVTFAQKGIVQLELEAETIPGARNAPWNGFSAAELLANSLAAGLPKLCPEQRQLQENDNWGSTACVLSIETEPNGISPPCRARASVRLYWAGEQAGADVIEIARQAFHPLKVSGVVDGERVFLSPESVELRRLREIWQRRLGRPIDIRADNGSSDAKWFVGLGIPILILRTPGDGAHADEEWLEVAALRPLYDTLRECVQEDSTHTDSQRRLRTDEADLGPPPSLRGPVGQPAEITTGLD
ncbi:Acetylornithine deacetylase [Pseudobythopirellula maris]|uniref:Acetylornithine deacetylase n=1 Tax=Pseudobythopirellula maris TaxID=2527991 RepID=A0A5C5ZTV9_9BACT|nr:M20/M25/M40 family metallo-hydrolase [Pseudobythopirellula maris]TWT90301.1 Acetylornithine deacetylase [Pseudobythopirellula maris]